MQGGTDVGARKGQLGAMTLRTGNYMSKRCIIHICNVRNHNYITASGAMTIHTVTHEFYMIRIWCVHRRCDRCCSHPADAVFIRTVSDDDVRPRPKPAA